MKRRGKVRLDRALSKRGVASRAEARRLILDRRVRIGGRIITDPSHLVVPETADVLIDDEQRPRAVWRMLALNKPRGILTTRRDPDGRTTVFDLLGRDGEGLVAVGRLDLASTGLLLLTTDTQLANALTDPANEIRRTYVVTVRGSVTDANAKQMVAGVGELAAAAVQVRKRSRRETHLVVELTEGRNREIRRMLEALGHPVTTLLRVAFGPFDLGDLQPGQWREISPTEVDAAGLLRSRRRPRARHDPPN